MSRRTTVPAQARCIDCSGQRIEVRVKVSRTAKQFRLRVGLDGVEVLRPVDRDLAELDAFVFANLDWLRDQIRRIERLRTVRAPREMPPGQILFRGRVVPVVVETKARRSGTNKVLFDGDLIRVVRGAASRTSPERTLENWLRREARSAIESLLPDVCARIDARPRRVFVMAQRTKWGGCSSLGNLSFNWRLILAPDYVQRYLVVHEAVHLRVPDHSSRFWLTVKGLCPETERARQWLCANVEEVLVALKVVCHPVSGMSAERVGTESISVLQGHTALGSL